MARRNLNEALAHVFRDEGGYVDHPRDPGGATNMGITRATLARHRRRPVSKREVRDLTVQEASAIYEATFWNAVRADDLPSGVDYCVFDAAVHSGPSRAARWLQAALGVRVDGAVGPVTIEAAGTADPADLIRRICKRRLGFMKALRTWRTFGRGWARRMRLVEASALSLAAHSEEPKHEPKHESKRRRREMTDAKKWYESKTVWGAATTILAVVAGAFGLPVEATHQAALAELIPQVIAIGGALVALFGRMSATTVIR